MIALNGLPRTNTKYLPVQTSDHFSFAGELNRSVNKHKPWFGQPQKIGDGVFLAMSLVFFARFYASLCVFLYAVPDAVQTLVVFL